MFVVFVLREVFKQEKGGSLPVKCYFILNTFPVVIFGLFSDTERPAILPTGHRSMGFMSFFPSHIGLNCTSYMIALSTSQPIQSRIYSALLLLFYNNDKQIASSFLRRQPLDRTPSWPHLHTVLLVF